MMDIKLPSNPNLKSTDISDHLLDFRIEIIRRAALAVIFVAGTAAWMLMSQNPFPGWGFLILLGLIGLAVMIRRRVEEHPSEARYILLAGLLAGVMGQMLVNVEIWIPFMVLPVVFLSSILIKRGEFVSGGIAFLLTSGLVMSGWREYPLLAYSISLVMTISVAWVVIFMVNTSLSWYQVMLEQSNHLLSETRQHRGELSKALKNLTLANELQRRTEQELILARKNAEEARILKEKFAAKVSHELRTPLALIAGFSEVMYTSPEIYGDVTWTPTMRRDISQVYRNSHHLLAMVDDILNLSRFEIAGFTISLEDVNVNDLLDETAEIARDLFRSDAVRFWTDIPAGFPLIRLDRTRIRQVVLNLINNARRFTEKGEVCLSAHLTSQEMIISVRDTGPGIPESKLELIFQEFYQVEDRLLKNKGGTGLGLTICKHFVETHGGRTWAESELGKGSTFYFSLPLGGAILGENNPTESNLLAAFHPRILVIGADDHVLAMLRSTVSGYEVVKVESKEQLPPIIALYHPRAVVWNVLPGDDENEPLSTGDFPIPIIRCSLPSTLWLVKEYDIQACLSKPASHDVLVRELDRLPDVRSILLIDDDQDYSQLMQRILQTIERDFEVSVTSDGAKGLEAIQRFHPDLVFLDLTLPDMDGFAVISAMKARPDCSKIPVILLTATLTPERLLTFPANRVVIERKNEMQTIETLNLVKASLDVLETHYKDTTDDIIMKINQP